MTLSEYYPSSVFPFGTTPIEVIKKNMSFMPYAIDLPNCLGGELCSKIFLNKESKSFNETLNEDQLLKLLSYLKQIALDTTGYWFEAEVDTAMRLRTSILLTFNIEEV